MKTLATTVASVFLSGLTVAVPHVRVFAQTPAPASIAGRVVDKVSGQPIGKATVRVSTIQDPSRRAAQMTAALAAARSARDGTPAPAPAAPPEMPVNVTVDTAVDGAFAFAQLPPGEYQLTVTTDRYVTYEYGQRIVGGKGAPLTLRAGERIEALSLPLTKKGSLAGTIVDQNGVALPDVAIRVYTQFLRPNQLPQFVEVGVMRFSGDVGMVEPLISSTDEFGRYRMENLDPGEY